MISKSQFLKRLRFNPLTTKNNQSGIALLLAITSLMFMVYIASEVTKDSAVEYIVNSQEMSRVKSYYAARNGMQIALLRIKMFQQIAGSVPEDYKQYTDLIWQYPFAWPLPIPEDLNAVDKDLIAETTQDSLMDTTYTHTIEDEGSKIDLNDLASPSKTLREITRKQLLSIFEQKVMNDDEFRNAYANINFEDIVNRIQDWMSDTYTSASGGGDKRGDFSQLGEGYPPNRGFRTLEELRLVPGIDETVFRLLAERVTIYGMKAINPNTASKEVLLALDPNMTAEVAEEIIKRREDPQLGGPFKGAPGQGGSNADDNQQQPSNGGTQSPCNDAVRDFINADNRIRLSEEFSKIPMICDRVFNFKVTAIGLYGSGNSALQKKITAYVMDLGKSASQIKTYLEKEKREQERQNGQQPPQNPPGTPPPAGQTGPATSSPPKENLPKGPPRVVYWQEF